MATPTARYMAPELLDPPQFGLRHSNPSKESDIYSFAMTAYEVFFSYLVARVTIERLTPLKGSLGGLAVWCAAGERCCLQYCVRQPATSPKQPNGRLLAT